jgi:hypothetical protein
MKRKKCVIYVGEIYPKVTWVIILSPTKARNHMNVRSAKREFAISCKYWRDSVSVGGRS